MSAKDTFITALRTSMTRMAQAMEDAPDLAALYTDRGYDPNHSGSDPIVTGDVSQYGLTGDDVYLAVQTLLAFVTYMQGGSPAYHVTVNKLRTDR